ncbi:MAG: hypothetical protein KGD73_04460 [Candidatus Lokiarchaeota archaeon]|nr:hypothetical protein [Candidatus Lokiarchaeota archaeon]
MSDKRNMVEDNKISDLVSFRDEKPTKGLQKEVISLEQIDQEDKIKLIHELKPYGSMYRYSSLIANYSKAPIKEVKIKIRFPEFLDLIRSDPSNMVLDPTNLEEDEDKQVRIQFNEIAPESHQQVNVFLSPLDLEGEGEIRSYVTFVNNKDFVRALDSKPILIMFTPFSIERKIIPSSHITPFSNSPDNVKAIKSIGIGVDDQFDPDFFFTHVCQTIQDHNFQLISINEKNRVAWYFGVDLVSGDDVLIIGQIVQNKIEWIAVTKNPHLLISLLSEVSSEFATLMIISGIIESINQIYDLECKYCGTPLSYIPKKGVAITCLKCNNSQVVWN